jgi:hypothetical protein
MSIVAKAERGKQKAESGFGEQNPRLKIARTGLRGDF